MTARRFTFDANRCTGCQACVLGCWMEHRGRQAAPWRHVETFNPGRHPDLPGFRLSLACHHCEMPACLENCPAGAYTKDPATGTVTLHAGRCMGCRYCTWACPHDAPRFDQVAGTVEKCTFCPERQAQGLEPACVARCPVEALGMEGRDPAPDPVFPGIPPSSTRPGIRLVPLRREGPPELGFAPSKAVMAPFLDRAFTVLESKITLRGEWGLVVFTTVFAGLAAGLAATGMGGPRLSAGAFLGAGLAAMALAALHLGRPARAWRAGLNLATSWLSREVILASAFLGLGGLHLLGVLPGRVWGGFAALLGFAALFAIDRLYRVALKTGPWNLHSAHALFNGLYLLGILAQIGPLALGAGLAKLGLFLHRKRHVAREGRRIRPLGSTLRVASGFLAPALLWAWSPLGAGFCAVLGDLLDRCEYYADLEIPTPAGHLAAEARGRLDQRPSPTEAAT